MTRNTSIGLYEDNDWNENNVNTLTTNNWRASLVPAAAVIPAPIVYTKVVAVKKLVVGFRFKNIFSNLLQRDSFDLLEMVKTISILL